LADIGVPPEKASAIVADLLLIDWWCLQATVILARWDLEQNAEAAVRLVEIMARSIRRSRLWQRWGEGHGKCWGDHRLARADPQLPLIELLPLRSAPLIELPNYNCSN
jgi:hypothetical protein